VDLVVLSEVRWGYFRTRKQFLLSRFPKDRRIFFAQPPAAGADDPWTPRREGQVTTFTVPFLKPATTSGAYNALAATAAGRAAIEWVAERWLASRLREIGVEPEPVILVSNIYCPGALERMRKRAVFYDYNDHPFQFAGVPEWTREYWPRTARQVDHFFAVSEFYRRELERETDRPVTLIGNGVEYEHFAAPRAIPTDLAAWPRPWIGYLGLLSHFLDFDTLETLRAGRRGGTLVLIGPGSPATDERIRALAAREGVACLGARPYEEVPAYMQALDVGVIPFRAQDRYVQGINPNKVYQYLAAGRPVVTTPVQDLAPLFPALQFASSPAEMAAAVGAALDAGVRPEACRSLARPHDWSGLADRMVSEMERTLSMARSVAPSA
jgi:glycosyltransferase involved in cell wall biosynthesis